MGALKELRGRQLDCICLTFDGIYFDGHGVDVSGEAMQEVFETIYENYGIGVDIRRGDSCLESVRIGLLSVVRTALYSDGLAVLLGLWFFSGNHSQRIEARQEI